MLDVACGTGHHAAMFHAWGLEVEGADVSAAMLASSATPLRNTGGLHWACRDFTAAGKHDRLFDVVLCVGNSLALAPDLGTARTAVTRMFDATVPGGLVIVHVANLWRLPDGPCVWQKCVPLESAPAAVPFSRDCTGRESPAMLTWLSVAGERTRVCIASRFAGWDWKPDALVAWSTAAGGSVSAVHGGYGDEPYQRDTSVDLIMIARKARS